MAKTSEKLELISDLRESLSEKEIQYKEVSDRLLQTEHTVSLSCSGFFSVCCVSVVNDFSFSSFQLDTVSLKCSSSEKRCSELKTEVSDLTQKFTVLKDKV